MNPRRSLLLAAMLSVGPLARAQHPAADAGVRAEELVAADSPRASMTRFLSAARAGRWDEAAEYLDVPSARRGEAPTLARELLEVLDRHVWIDPSALSPEPQGDASDGLPSRTDEVARVPGPSGALEPVRVTRVSGAQGQPGRWVFSRQTTGRIEVWFRALEGRWLRERLPPWALRRSARDLAVWQWIALPLIALAALAVGRVLAALTNRALARVVDRVWPNLADALRDRARGPVTGLWMVPLSGIGVGMLQLYPPAAQAVDGVLRAALFAAVFWGVWGTVGLVAHAVLESPWARANPSSETLVPLGTRVLKVIVFALAVTAVLSALGYPVASLIAGLGVGGLALALAAQKTGEHLFGSFAIGLDQPFRVGDFVRVDAHSGTVESLGLRSTRIRTMGRTLVTIPNGKLADLRVENFTLRDRFYFNPTFALASGADPDRVEALLQTLTTIMREHPTRADDEPNVFIKTLGAEGITVEVQCWLNAESWTAFLPLRTELALVTLRAVHDSGLPLIDPLRVLRAE